MTTSERDTGTFVPPKQGANEWGSTYAMRVRAAERTWQREHKSATVGERTRVKSAAADAMREART